MPAELHAGRVLSDQGVREFGWIAPAPARDSLAQRVQKPGNRRRRIELIPLIVVAAAEARHAPVGAELLVFRLLQRQ